MVVVGVLGVLAALAIPNYVRYTLRAKQTEAYTVLSMIKNQQFSYYASYDCFTGTQSHPPGVPSTDVRPWFPIATTGLVGTCGNVLTFEDLDLKPNRSGVYFTYDCDTNAAGPSVEFSCNAIGDLDGDGAQVEFVFCTDNNNDGVTVPSPVLGSPCNFVWDPVRLSAAAF